MNDTWRHNLSVVIYTGMTLISSLSNISRTSDDMCVARESPALTDVVTLMSLQADKKASGGAVVCSRIPSSAAWKPLFIWSFVIPERWGQQQAKAWSPLHFPSSLHRASHCMTETPSLACLPHSSPDLHRTCIAPARRIQASRTSTCQLLFIAIPVDGDSIKCRDALLKRHASLLEVVCQVKALSVTVLLAGFSTSEQNVHQTLTSPSLSSAGSGSLLNIKNPSISDQETFGWSSTGTDKSENGGSGSSDTFRFSRQAAPSYVDSNLRTQRPLPVLSPQGPYQRTPSWPWSRNIVDPWIQEEPETVIHHHTQTPPSPHNFEGNSHGSHSSNAQTELSLPDDDNFHYGCVSPTTALIIGDALDPGATSDACSSTSDGQRSSRAKSPASTESQSELPETFLLLPLAVTSALNFAFPSHHEPSHPSHTLATCLSLPRNRPPYVRCSLDVVSPYATSPTATLGAPKRSLDMTHAAAPITLTPESIGSFSKHYLDLSETAVPNTPVTPVSMNSLPSCDSTSHLGEADCDVYTYAASSQRSTASEFGHHHRSSSGCSRSFACEFGQFDTTTLPQTVPAHSSGGTTRLTLTRCHAASFNCLIACRRVVGATAVEKKTQLLQEVVNLWRQRRS